MAEPYGGPSTVLPTLSQKVEPKPYFGIIFMGDTGEPGPNQAKVAKAIENFCVVERCSIGLLLGDNFYPAGVKDAKDPAFKAKFEEPYKNLSFKFYPVVGNHDAMGSVDAQVEYKSDHWEMPSLYYAMDGGWVNFYALDTNWSAFQRPFHSKPQREWLENEIPKGDAQWKIVYGHHPVFSSGWHGDTAALKKYLKPMLDKGKVDFYLSGHDHDKELFEVNGVKYVVMGTGAKLRTVKGKGSVFAKASLGFGHLLLSEKSALLRFVNEKGDVEFERKYLKD